MHGLQKPRLLPGVERAPVAPLERTGQRVERVEADLPAELEFQATVGFGRAELAQVGFGLNAISASRRAVFGPRLGREATGRLIQRSRGLAA
jgi:hypothetical protein